MEIVRSEIWRFVLGHDAFIVKLREVASTKTLTRQDSSINRNWHS
jgi:hypothetical protein